MLKITAYMRLKSALNFGTYEDSTQLKLRNAKLDLKISNHQKTVCLSLFTIGYLMFSFINSKLFLVNYILNFITLHFQVFYITHPKISFNIIRMCRMVKQQICLNYTINKTNSNKLIGTTE